MRPNWTGVFLSVVVCLGSYGLWLNWAVKQPHEFIAQATPAPAPIQCGQYKLAGAEYLRTLDRACVLTKSGEYLLVFGRRATVPTVQEVINGHLTANRAITGSNGVFEEDACLGWEETVRYMTGAHDPTP